MPCNLDNSAQHNLTWLILLILYEEFFVCKFARPDSFLHLSLSCICSSFACYSVSITIWCTSAQLVSCLQVGGYFNISVNLVAINFEGETFVDFVDF